MELLAFTVSIGCLGAVVRVVKILRDHRERIEALEEDLAGYHVWTSKGGLEDSVFEDERVWRGEFTDGNG